MTPGHYSDDKSTADSCWQSREGDGPLVAVASHNGHQLRNEVRQIMALGDADRLREEDPYTGEWAVLAATRMVALRSRFEVDLNRSREIAVYISPQDAWGLKVWKQSPDAGVISRSLQQYDAYYHELQRILKRKARQYPAFVVFDLHSYNHRRAGPQGAPADPRADPEINLGTRTMQRDYWAPLVDRFISDLQDFDFLGRHLDVRENVKFGGRQVPQWAHTEFPNQACVLAIEVKKFFMDEWTSELDRVQHHAIFNALQSTLPGMLKELAKLGAVK